MSDSTQPPSKSSSASDDQPIKQEDIDALFASSSTDSAASNDPVVAEPPAKAGGSDAVNQDDVDALINAAADGESDGAPPDATSDAAEEVQLDSVGRPFDEAAEAMQAAIEEERNAQPATSGASTGDPVPLPDFEDSLTESASPNQVSMLNDVKLRVKIQLGRTEMLVEDVLKLGEGSVVELDKLAGDPVDVLVNDRLVARGEVLVLNDNFCVRISEVLTHDPHRVVT